MREKAEDLLGDFQAVVGGWPSSLSWESASTPDFRTFPMHPLKKSEAGEEHCPDFSLLAPKPDPCTRIAAVTDQVNTMGVEIYPTQLVFWGSCSLAPGRRPGHPLDSLGRALPWDFPACPFGIGPRTVPHPGGGRSGGKYDFARGLAFPLSDPVCRLRTIPGQVDFSNAPLKKMTPAGDTSWGHTSWTA